MGLKMHEDWGTTPGAIDCSLAVAEQYAGGIDLVVTDLVMPEMGGKELAERLRAHRPGLKVLFMSGYTDDDVFRRRDGKEIRVTFTTAPMFDEQGRIAGAETPRRIQRLADPGIQQTRRADLEVTIEVLQ